MDEIEVPLESVQEKIHETAHHSGDKWTGRMAFFSAVVAAIAAVAALIAGHHSNEAMITQIKASDNWSYFQAKGIKASVLSSKNELLKELGKSPSAKDEEKVAEYKKEQDEIIEKAKELERESEHHLTAHVVMARAVTMFQIAIAMAAITILTKRRKFFAVSLGFSLLGLVFFVLGLLK